MMEYKLLPVEPTEEMIAAANAGDREYSLRNFGMPGVLQGPYDHWIAMVAAAPVIEQEPPCPNGLLPDGPTCPRCGGKRGPSGVDGGSWVHYQAAPASPQMYQEGYKDGKAAAAPVPQQDAEDQILRAASRLVVASCKAVHQAGRLTDIKDSAADEAEQAFVDTVRAILAPVSQQELTDDEIAAVIAKFRLEWGHVADHPVSLLALARSILAAAPVPQQECPAHIELSLSQARFLMQEAGKLHHVADHNLWQEIADEAARSVLAAGDDS